MTKSTINIAYNLIQHVCIKYMWNLVQLVCIKHVEVDIHFIIKKLDSGLICIPYVSAQHLLTSLRKSVDESLWIC